MKKHTHINGKGEFQSDKYPELGPDKIVLSFKDPLAQCALYMLALDYMSGHVDEQLGRDISQRLRSLLQEKTR